MGTSKGVGTPAGTSLSGVVSFGVPGSGVTPEPPGPLLCGLGFDAVEPEHEIGDLLHLGRNLRQLADRDLAVGVVARDLACLIDRRDRIRIGHVVEGVQEVGADGSILLPQHLELDRNRQRRGAVGIGNLDVEADFDLARGAANAHGRDRRTDFHVAMLGGLAGEKGDGPLHQVEERRVRRPVRIVDHVVQHHPRIGRETEHGAVDEGDAELRIGSGLDHVALVDVVAHVQHDRNAVADHGGVAGELGYVADDLARIRRAAGLGILNVTGKRVDDVAGQTGAIGRHQRGMLVAGEIILDDLFAAVLRQDQIGAGPLVVARKQQIGVGDRNGVAVAVMRKFMDIPRLRMRPLRSVRIFRQSSNGAPQKVNTCIIFDSRACIASESAMRKHLAPCTENFRDAEREVLVLTNDCSEVILSTRARRGTIPPNCGQPLTAELQV